MNGLTHGRTYWGHSGKDTIIQKQSYKKESHIVKGLYEPQCKKVDFNRTFAWQDLGTLQFSCRKRYTKEPHLMKGFRGKELIQSTK
jgi:hypothetical protein